MSWLFLDLPHAAFEVRLSASVEVVFPAPPDAECDASLGNHCGSGSGRVDARLGRSSEFAFASPMAPADAAAGAYAAVSFPPDRPVLAGLLDLMARIRRDFTFRPGVTTIATPVARC